MDKGLLFDKYVQAQRPLWEATSRSSPPNPSISTSAKEHAFTAPPVHLYHRSFAR
jgi:hypothetical protein